MKKLFERTGIAQMIIGGAFVIAALPANAAPAPPNYFTLPVDFNSVACATYGDFVSCSAQYLNYVTYGDVDGASKTDSYVQAAPEGQLQKALVVFTGSGANYDNTDLGTNIDNAYVPGGGPGSSTSYGTSPTPDGKGGTFYTGDKANTTLDPEQVVAGEVSGSTSGTIPTAWDIGLKQLISFLTIDGVRRDMLIMYDNNQVGTTADQTIFASARICVRDTVDPTVSNKDLCFELVDQNGAQNYNSNGPVTGYTTPMGYSDPLYTAVVANGPSAVTAHGSFCVDTSSKQVVMFDVASQSACPNNSVFVNNSLGTNESEFFVTLPELNAQLDDLLADGYDLFSFRFNFTNNTNGFENIYMLAGDYKRVPEPSMIALLGLGLFGLGISRLRRRR